MWTGLVASSELNILTQTYPSQQQTTSTYFDLPDTPPMTSSVPSVEDFKNAFPTQVTPIIGEPTYATLKTLKDQLKANAASVPTTLGGGKHGYLGLILSPATYATISPTAFIEPVYPGQHPAIPAGTSAANTSTIIQRHTEDTRQWREFKNVSTALKNQLLSAVEDIYVRALRDRHVGYMNQSIRNLLTHLFENYGNITQLELEDNDTKMRSLWDPNSPFDCLVQQLEDGQDYANDDGQPYTTDQLLRIAYTLVFKTGLYLKIAKPGMPNPTMKKHGQISKHTSTVPNACSVTNFAQPNRPALPATARQPSTNMLSPSTVTINQYSPDRISQTAFGPSLSSTTKPNTMPTPSSLQRNNNN